MYRPLGMCLNDFDVSYNPHKEQFELIHLQGPPIANTYYDAVTMETSYGHAVSSDLVNWRARANVFGIDESGDAFDDSAIWTMHTIFSPDFSQRYMFYTGLTRAQYFKQQIGMAVYDFAAESWERVDENPVVSADPRWYQQDGKMAWRDPYVVYDEEEARYVMFISAKQKDIAVDKNGCIAYATSKNLKDWQVHPPLIAPQTYNEVECPVYFKKGDYHYILTSISDDYRVHVWRSQNFLDGYEEIGCLTEPYHYAPRVLSYNGHDIVLHTRWIERPDKDGNPVWSRGYLDDPQLLVQDEGGLLSLTPYPFL